MGVDNQAITDWTSDPRPFAEIAKSWPKAHGWTRTQAAAKLRVPLATYHSWCAGARTPPEGMVRYMMVLIDFEFPTQASAS